MLVPLILKQMMQRSPRGETLMFMMKRGWGFQQLEKGWVLLDLPHGLMLKLFEIILLQHESEVQVSQQVHSSIRGGLSFVLEELVVEIQS